MSRAGAAPGCASSSAVFDQLDAPAGAAALRRNGLDDEPGLMGLLDYIADLVHRDPVRAERLAVLCEQMAHTPALTGVRARACYLRAQILAERGELVGAGELIERARQLWLSCGDHLAALRANLGRMQVLDDLGSHDAAIRVGHDLIDALDRLPSGTDGRAAAQIRVHATENLGVAYAFTGRPTLALEAYLRAESGYRDLGMLRESARPIASRGVELRSLGRAREALVDFARAAAIFAATGDDLFAAQCRGDAATAHRQLGEFAQALRLLEQARHALQRLGAVVEADRLKLALAETYLEAGLWAEASATAQQVASASTISGRSHDAAMAHYLTALGELSMGRAYRSMRSLEKAQALFDQVGDLQYSARVRLSRAEASAMLGRDEHARELLEECVTVLSEGGWVVPLVWAYLRQFDLSSSLEQAQERLEKAGVLITGLDLPEVTYQFELRTARADRRRGDLGGAERHLRQAVAAVDAVSGTLPDHLLRAAFRAERFTAHSELIDLLVERGGQGDVARAARISDAVKVCTLSDLLTAGDAGQQGQAAVSDDELAAVFAELSGTYLALQNEQQRSRRETLAARAQALEHRVTTRGLRGENDGRQVAASPAPPDFDPDLDGMARDPVIAYHVTGEDILAFVSIGACTRVRRLPRALPQVHNLLDSLADQWSRFALGIGLGLSCRDELLRTTQDDLAHLHTVLIAPLSELLPAGGDHLFVVPHAPMGAVPFHALFDGRHYLLERCSVTVASTRAAATVDRARADIAGAAVVVAVPDSYAPQARNEADLVAGLLPAARVLVGADATTGAVVAASAGAHVLHLACHGVHRASSPLFSRLRLADRWMTSAEIIHLDLAGALVVLSACESGSHGRGAEPIGIGWAFLAAGAAGVLVTLWEVHDEATLTLMAEFYRLLTAGATPEQALRRAQLHTASHYPHPFYWAPFSYITSPLNPTRSVRP